MTDPKTDYQAVIVGTGFGGMGVAIQFQRLGIHDVLMLDRASDLGGTWNINQYPGLAVDIASVSYSYSFEPNPYWSRRYCPGAEIKAYADHVAEKYHLRKLMRFNTAVSRAEFDEAGKFWTVYPDTGEPITTRFLVLATGLLSQPKMPDIAGVESFEGKVVHTAQWDHDYDFHGKRAAVIGTGASSVQAMPILAEQVKQMDVYQRTPIWVYPKDNPEISPRMQAIYARFPLVQRAVRFVSDTVLETLMVTAILHAKQFPGLLRKAENACRRHLEKQVPDPELRKKLTPSYSFGCKRPTFSNDYFPTFMRDNVELITDPIGRIEADAIVTKDGTRREIDTLVLATGFNLWERGNFPAFEVVGKNNKELGAQWRASRYKSFEGLTIPGFPNLFDLNAPYSYSGFCYFNQIEIQMKHIERCIKKMQRLGAYSFEVKQEAQERFTERMHKRGQNSVLEVGHCAPANSYYFNPHGDYTLLRLTSARKGLRNARRFPMNSYSFS